MNEKYVRDLENIIKQMLQPLKNIPLNLVIEAISGYQIETFNPNDSKDKKLLDKLIQVAEIAGLNVNDRLILRPRPNEVGNDIEPYVKEALSIVGYQSDIPKTQSGRKKLQVIQILNLSMNLEEHHILSAKHTT
ncbi:MAG: hypothetical protein QME81_16955 [bacterium]|nr:hypothetical protein [bacterium]